MSDYPRQIYSFAKFRVDTNQRLVFTGDEVVTLTPKAFDILLALIENRGEVLSKEDLMHLVWPDLIVEENNLAQNIHKLRKALDDGVGGEKYIETIPKRGYRFIATVEALADPPRPNLAADRRGGREVDPARLESSSRRLSPPVQPKTHYATSTGDVNIAYQVVGEGELDLVFVMGWVSHLESFWNEPSFCRFLTRLASFSRLIIFDKRGTGLSDRVPVQDLPTLEQRMTDVQAVMDAVGSESAALLGVSEGGPMCSLFAATYPERTTAIVMIGTYAKRTWAEDYPWAPTDEEQAHFLEEVKKNWGGPVGLEERAPSVADDPRFRDWWSTYLRMGASPGAALALTRMNAEIDVRNVLPSIRVPALVIHRKGDALLPVEGGRYVASRIPGAKYVELDGNDHLPFVGDQDAILDEIEEFLTGARHVREIDRVLMTVLFVHFYNNDEGISATKCREIGELYQSHIRRELALFRGKEIEMTDASLFVTFDGPARAIRCALAIAEAGARLGFNIRAGLHTGECDIQGEKIGGVTVRLVEDISLLADIGEILISNTVKDLVGGSGIEFESRGTHAFENLPGRWKLFKVRRSAGR